MSQRTEDSVRREVLARTGARGAPECCRSRRREAQAEAEDAAAARVAARKSGGLFGCFGGGKKKYKVHQDPDMPDMDDNALPHEMMMISRIFGMVYIVFLESKRVLDDTNHPTQRQLAEAALLTAPPLGAPEGLVL